MNSLLPARFRGGRLVGTVGTTLAITGVSVVTSVLLARNLGPDGRGALLALTFWPTLLFDILCLSLNEGTTYHVARATVQTPDESGRYAASGLALQGLIALTVTPVALAAILAFRLGHAHHGVWTVFWYAVFFTPLSLADLHFKAVMQGRGDFRALNLTRAVQPLGYAITLTGLALSGRFMVSTVMAAILLTVAVSALVGAGFSRQPRPRLSRRAGREILTTALKFHSANLAYVAATEADKFIVLQLMNTTDVGYYALGIGLSGLGSGIAVQSLALMLSRDMPAAATADDRVGLIARNLAIGGSLLIGINLVGAISAPWWLPMVYGAEFKPALPVVVILLCVGTVKGARQIIDRAMRASRIVRVGIVSELVALAGLIVFGCVGAVADGLEGFVCGLAAAQLIAFLVIWHLTARTFAISSYRLAVLCRAGAGSAGGGQLKQIFGGLP